MRKALVVLSGSILALSAMGSAAFAQSHEITRLTNNTYQDFGARINNTGMVVWVGKPDVPEWYGKEYHEIFLYDGASTIRLTHNVFEDANPQINDDGHVVWHGFDGEDFEIFLYDGTAVTQITHNDFTDINPQIDTAGHVVWRSYYNHWCGDNDIFRYDGSSVARINDLRACNGDPVVNRLGHAVWDRSRCGRFSVTCELYDHDLFFYDGVSTINLTNTPTKREIDPHLNDNDWVVWTETNAGPGGVGNQEVYLHDRLSATRLTFNDTHDRSPRINNNGYVVWMGYGIAVGGEEIYVYDGVSTVQLTDNLYFDRFPQINNSNHVVWQGRVSGDYDEAEIFLYDGSTVTRLTDDTIQDEYPRIGDNGQIAWTKRRVAPQSEIYLATPAVQEHSVHVEVPTTGQALQDGVTLAASVSGYPVAPDVYMYVREPGGPYGVPAGFDDLAAPFNAASGRFEHELNSAGLPDGPYVVFAKAVGAAGGEVFSEVVPVTIRNWSVVELLPATRASQAGRTMPVKFAIRIAKAADPAQPFVWNEDLEIRIYAQGDPESVLQVSHFGVTSVDYRIDATAGHYITNFKTGRAPAEYIVEVWRPAAAFMVGSFTFATVN